MSWPLLKPVTVGVEASDAIQFARAVGADDPLHLDETHARRAGLRGVLAAPTLLFSLRARHSPILPILDALGFADRPGRMFHGEQSFRYMGPVCAGDRLTFQDRVDDVRRGEGGASSSVVVATQVTDAWGSQVAMLKYTAVILGQSGSSRGGNGRNAQGVTDCSEGEPVAKITPSLVDAYAVASHDRNPIHVDDSYARSVGLPGIIGHGMLTMGLMFSVICRLVPVLSLRSARMNFKAPTLLDDQLFLHPLMGQEGRSGAFRVCDQAGRRVAEGGYEI